MQKFKKNSAKKFNKLAKIQIIRKKNRRTQKKNQKIRKLKNSAKTFSKMKKN